MSQINTLVQVIIPNWFQKSVQPFRLWSAACATGEEPYTIRMALAEAGMSALPVEIIATDASLSALEKARRGVFRDKSFRTLPEDLRQKYFERVPEGWKISEALKARVAFERANLFQSGEVARFARVPAIFCRNVFIYFSPHAIRQTVATVAAKMSPGGYLFVGASESLLRMTTDFELKEIAGALVYVRT
jgi:chemotaxis protein methyltransferase CheR